LKGKLEEFLHKNRHCLIPAALNRLQNGVLPFYPKNPTPCLDFSGRENPSDSRFYRLGHKNSPEALLRRAFSGKRESAFRSKTSCFLAPGRGFH
jgi:hypothetical protein